MIWSEDEKKTLPIQYNCELLFHNAEEAQIKSLSLPSDAYIVEYTTEKGDHVDLCRSSKMSNIFDLYYDKIGNNIRKIDFGYGRVNPKLWGYSAPEKKRRKQ
jgi:hypothetical protein